MMPWMWPRGVPSLLEKPGQASRGGKSQGMDFPGRDQCGQRFKAKCLAAKIPPNACRRGDASDQNKGIPEAIEAGEDRARLRIAVKQLKPLEKEVFLMRQNGDLTLEEIAHELGRPVGTVKTQLRSALGKLRIALGEPDRGEPDRSEPDRKTKGGNEES